MGTGCRTTCEGVAGAVTDFQHSFSCEFALEQNSTTATEIHIVINTREVRIPAAAWEDSVHNISVFVHTPGRTTTTFAICGFHDALNFHFSDNAVIRQVSEFS